MQDLTEQLVGFADALGAVSKNAQDVENSLGNDKTKKGLKSIDGMLMNMAKSSASAIALEQLMKLIEPFLLLLEPLGVIFDILGALLTVFTGEIMKSLFDALQPLFEILIALMPLFKVLGQLFGMIIEVGLEPLKVILEVLGTILKPFMPMLEKLSPIFELLGGVISWLVRLALLPLVAAIYAVGLGIAALINLFTFGAVDAIGSWNSLMLPMLGSMVGLANGGIVQSETMAVLGDNKSGKEAVVPLEKADQFGFGGNSDMLSSIDEKLEIQNQLIRRQGRSVMKRRFG